MSIPNARFISIIVCTLKIFFEIFVSRYTLNLLFNVFLYLFKKNHEHVSCHVFVIICTFKPILQAHLTIKIIKPKII